MGRNVPSRTSSRIQPDTVTTPKSAVVLRDRTWALGRSWEDLAFGGCLLAALGSGGRAARDPDVSSPRPLTQFP